MIAVWGPLLMVAQKELIDLGYGFVLNDHYDQRLSRFDPNYWKNLGTWKYLDKNDSGPTYKKWLEEEK